MTPADAWLRLALLPGLGPLTAAKLLDAADGDPTAPFTWSMGRLRDIDGVGPERSRRICDPAGAEAVATERAVCHKAGIRIIVRDDPDYPADLLRLPDPPLCIWMRGEIRPEDRLALAVVGPRKPSPYGHRIAHRWCGQLARLGVCLVSGLARGVDTVAHEQAVTAKGRTIAVIGSGFGRLYPEENASLADRIADGCGAVISELPFTQPPTPGTFPRRNRLVAALSLATLVVEAGPQSGALITARLCNEMGKMVLCVPGPVDNPESQGANKLIRDGATLVATVDEVLEEVEPLMTLATGMRKAASDAGTTSAAQARADSPRAAALSGREKQVYTLLNDQPRNVDDLVRTGALPPSVISATLLSLELKKLARRQTTGYVRAT
jgi:DNA processing protein